MKWQSIVILTTLFTTSLVGAYSTDQACSPCLSSYLPNRNATFVWEGSALFFKPHENGLAYGMLTKGDDIDTAFQTINAVGDFCFETDVKHPKFEWDTGFRIGFGYQPQCTCVSFSTNWMHFKGHAKGATEARFFDQEGSIFIGTWSGASALVNGPYFLEGSRVLTCAEADFKFCLDMVDVDAGYHLCLSPCLNLFPYMGVRIGSIDQMYHLENDYAIDTGEKVAILEKIKFSNKFTGVGLLFGSSADYYLGCGFALFGSAEVALLKGHFKIREMFEDFVASDPDEEFNRKACQREKFCLQRTITDLKFGGSWQTCICNCATFVLSLAWEQHLYYGQNQIRPIAITLESGSFGIDQSNRGDLGLQGVSLTAQLIY